MQGVERKTNQRNGFTPKNKHQHVSIVRKAQCNTTIYMHIITIELAEVVAVLTCKIDQAGICQSQMQHGLIHAQELLQ